jgi:hypothetical protein
MSNTRTYLWLAGLLLILGLSATDLHARRPKSRGEEAKTEQRSFDPNRLDGYRKDPKYHYDRDKIKLPKPREREEEREFTPAPRPRYSGPRWELGPLFKGIMWVLIIAVAIFLILQLFKVNFKSLFKKRSDKAKVVAVADIEEQPEDITKMEFEDLLQAAIDAGNFRIAVRLLYLRSLKLLTENGLIAWRQEKTNHQYLRELQDPSLKPKFGDVTLIFEYIWYGEVPVAKDEFNMARASFIEFEQSLRQKYAV